jgi:hypothetical protein
MIGKTLGHYEITNQLGRGSMAEVHQVKGRMPHSRTTGLKEVFMATKSCLIPLAAMLCLSLSMTRSDESFAKDLKLKPEEVVAAHIKSIGSPKALEAIKSRMIKGTTTVIFTQGGFGNLPEGQSLIISEGHKLGMILKYAGFDYPGEHFAFNGNDATVSCIDLFDKRSNLGGFIKKFHGIMREGLLGGTLSVAWPLLDVQERQPKLTYNKREVERRQLHELIYNPKSQSGVEGLQIKLLFDLETFRHVMTEYRFEEPGQVSPGVSGRRDTVQALSDPSFHVLREKFDNFSEVDGLMLPHRYTIEYSVTSMYSSLTYWKVEVKQLLHNAPIDPQLFKAEQPRSSNSAKSR